MNTRSAMNAARLGLRRHNHASSGVVVGMACLLAGVLATAADAGRSPLHTPCPLATPGGNGQAAGASNRITTCQVLSAIPLVRAGRIASLGHVYFDVNNSPDGRVTPSEFGRTYSLEPLGPYGLPDGIGTNRALFFDDYIQGNLGQYGTQLDSLRHAGTLNDTDGKDFFNGLPPEQLGVENIRPIFTRGILIDVAGLKGRMLRIGEEITMADVRDALRRQGLSAQAITSGDAVFFNTGWNRMYERAERGRPEDVAAWANGSPGIGPAVARWLVEKQVVVVGADNIGVEFAPDNLTWPDGAFFPLHGLLIADNGIFLHENLDFSVLLKNRVSEFVYVFVPVPFAGASGSPGNPIAIW
jgi:kynurenine formamidase